MLSQLKAVHGKKNKVASELIPDFLHLTLSSS